MIFRQFLDHLNVASFKITYVKCTEKNNVYEIIKIFAKG